SRRRHTRSKRDWSSDVCSSDLGECATVGDNDVAERWVNVVGVEVDGGGGVGAVVVVVDDEGNLVVGVVAEFHAAVGDEVTGSSEGVVGEGGDGVHVHGGGLSVWCCVRAVNTQCTSKLVNLSSVGVFRCSRGCVSGA